jgi:GNAT superfamily N-acetyltransferase
MAAPIENRPDGQVLIRKAIVQDVPHFYDICLKTGDNGKDASGFFRDPWLVGQYYAAPYLFFPGALCFTAEEDGTPRGYIVSAPDTAAFDAWMESVWLPPLRLRYPAESPVHPEYSSHEKAITAAIHKPHPQGPVPSWRTEYPAHLHIDMLPGIQGKGWGRRLMETLFAALRERGVPGLHLGVSRANTGALAFYGKIGFLTVQEEDSGGCTLGIKL